MSNITFEDKKEALNAFNVACDEYLKHISKMENVKAINYDEPKNNSNNRQRSMINDMLSTKKRLYIEIVKNYITVSNLIKNTCYLDIIYLNGYTVDELKKMLDIYNKTESKKLIRSINNQISKIDFSTKKNFTDEADKREYIKNAIEEANYYLDIRKARLR